GRPDALFAARSAVAAGALAAAARLPRPARPARPARGDPQAARPAGGTALRAGRARPRRGRSRAAGGQHRLPDARPPPPPPPPSLRRSTCAIAREGSMPTSSIAGVLLAAGTSSRMGTNKLFLRLGGDSVLRRAAKSAIAAGLDPLIVVLGHESDKARAELKGIEHTPVVNADYAAGMNTSLRAGIESVPDGAQAAVGLLADLPFVTPEMIP